MRSIQYLMVDIAPNHFGYNGPASTADYSTLNPFNSSKYFHPVSWITDENNQSQVELLTISATWSWLDTQSANPALQGWLGNEAYPLPDVDTTLSTARSMYASWIKRLIGTYSSKFFLRQCSLRLKVDQSLQSTACVSTPSRMSRKHSGPASSLPQMSTL